MYVVIVKKSKKEAEYVNAAIKMVSDNNTMVQLLYEDIPEAVVKLLNIQHLMESKKNSFLVDVIITDEHIKLFKKYNRNMFWNSLTNNKEKLNYLERYKDQNFEVILESEIAKKKLGWIKIKNRLEPVYYNYYHPNTQEQYRHTIQCISAVTFNSFDAKISDLVFTQSPPQGCIYQGTKNQYIEKQFENIFKKQVSIMSPTERFKAYKILKETINI
jgi:hypothetical protein